MPAGRIIPPISAVELAALEWEAEQEAERQRALQNEHTAAELAKIRESQTSEVWRIYKDDPVAWAYDMIEWPEGGGLAPYQEEVLAELPVRKRVSMRGPHVIGKSTIMSIAVLWFALTRDGTDWKIPTTASSWRQLTKFLWPEIRKWTRRLRWDKIGRQPFDRRTELLMYSLKLRTGEAFAMASDVPENMEGAHADHILGIFDESKAIPDETFDALEGAFAGTGETMALVVSTPGEPIGRFYDIHRRAPGTEDWWVRHVTMEEAIQSGRMSREWAEQRRKLWGEKSAVFQNRVLGEFAANDEDGVIPLAWIELANDRWRAIMEPPEDTPVKLPKFTGVGADIGSGSVRADKTVLALRYDNLITELRRYAHEDTMQTTGRIKGVIDAHGGRAIVDAIGIGAGVISRLREQRVRVYGFVASESTKKKDASKELGFANARSAAWWGLRERLDPSDNATLALPPDDLLTGDLTAPRYSILSGGKIAVESKDELRKPERLGRSTDDGDAVIQAFWEPEDLLPELPAPTGINRSQPGWHE